MTKTTPPLPVYVRYVPHLEMQALHYKNFACPQTSSRDCQMLGWLSTPADKIILGHYASF
jgi:hypothetical protein